MENIFKTFNENFFEDSKRNITWYDSEGVYVMDTNRVVTITLTDLGTRDHYNGYMVEIFDKNNGSIIKKFFRFQFHLEMIHRKSGSDNYYHVWYNNGKLDWYISRPKNTNVMINTIFDWLDKFR